MSDLGFSGSVSGDGVMVVRPFRGSDREALLGCWERALPLDGITGDDLDGRILLNEHFERGGLAVALVDGALAGFVSCFVLRQPIVKVGLREEDGFIQAMGVDPAFQGRGVGSALLAYGEKFFRERGRRRILMSPFTPSYFVPGVDKEAYAAGLEWLTRKGFVEYVEALAADALIGKFELSSEVREREAALAQEGVVVRPLERGDLVAFIEFMEEVMPGPWVEDARRVLGDVVSGRVAEDVVWVAVDSGANPENEERRTENGERIGEEDNGVEVGGAPMGSGSGGGDGVLLSGVDLSHAGDRAGVDDLEAGWTRDGRIIGFCQHEGEHFGPFGVAEGYQGRGIGSVLLARTLYRMRMKGCHSAWVLWTGERALKGVYGRLGFGLSRRFAILKKELGQ